MGIPFIYVTGSDSLCMCTNQCYIPTNNVHNTKSCQMYCSVWVCTAYPVAPWEKESPSWNHLDNI